LFSPFGSLRGVQPVWLNSLNPRPFHGNFTTLADSEQTP